MSDLIKAADKLETYLNYAVNGTWLAYHYELAKDALTDYRRAREGAQGAMSETWGIEEFKIWKGLDAENPRWACLHFAFGSYADAKELMDYMGANKRASIMRVVLRAIDTGE